MISSGVPRYINLLIVAAQLLLAPSYLFGQHSPSADATQRVLAAQTVQEGRVMLQELLATLQDRDDVQRTHAMLAELAELAGDFAAAQRHYRLAWDVREDQEALRFLLLSAQLRLELGDSAGAVGEAQVVLQRAATPGQRTEAQLLLLRSLIAEGNRATAVNELGSLWQSISDRSDPAHVYLVYDLARQLHQAEVADQALAELAQRHSESLEYSIARRDRAPHELRVERSPTPSQLFAAVPYEEPRAALPALPAPTRADGAAGAASARAGSATAQTVRAIQTGSFRDQENATYMARDISKAGFPVEVRRRLVDDQTLYQVLVPLQTGTPRAAALETMTRLKEAGIEGFLLFD